MTQVQWAKAGTLLPKELADLQAYPTVPVVTLDALEAWLVRTLGEKDRNETIDALLAQVRKWKETGE